MSAQKKIEKLTDSWYGFALFSGILNVLINGFGILSLLWTVGITLFSLVLTFIIGRRLIAKGKITRLFLLVISGLSTVLGTLYTATIGMAFISNWSFAGLLQIVLLVSMVLMHARSFRTLTDSQVKSFIKG